MFEWLIVGGTLGLPGERAAAVRLGVLTVQLALLVLVVRGVINVRGTSRAELPLLLLGLPVALLAIGMTGAERYYVERSGLTVLPFLAIAIGVGVASGPGLSGKRRPLRSLRCSVPWCWSTTTPSRISRQSTSPTRTGGASHACWPASMRGRGALSSCWR